MLHKRKFWALMLGLVCVKVFAQDITIEEMKMLDNLRSQYSAQGVEVKPEDEVRFLQRIRAMKAMAGGGLAGAGLSAPIWSAAPQPVAVQPVQTAVPLSPTAQTTPAGATESALRMQLDSLPRARPLSSFARQRDGMVFNGQRYADAEGPADRFALDPDTATAAYVVQMGGYLKLKIARLGTGAEPVTVGRLSRNGAATVFQSQTGKTLQGDLFFPMTDGVLLTRDSVGFRYVVGEGVRQIDFPSGWSPAPLQRGNMAATGWLLLERDTVEENKSPFAALKAIGEMVGAVAARMDYALFNMSDKRMVPFEISTDGKSVANYSQCRRASNGLYNICDKMTTYDSIWRPDGVPNWSHYFWKTDWQNMEGRPVAVVMENGLQQVNAYDLLGTKRVNLFERGMGIHSWLLEMSSAGKYRVKAQLAFDKLAFEDVASELKERPHFPRKQ